MPTILFLHGLDSSSQGTKGRYFQEYFPAIICPDFSGDLDYRLNQLEEVVNALTDLILIGSSFGGLMATCFTARHPSRVVKLILLAPALNYAGFTPPTQKIICPTLLIMGNNDTVCPPDLVLPLAEATFADLEIKRGNDDHLLRKMFSEIDWQSLLDQEKIISPIEN